MKKQEGILLSLAIEMDKNQVETLLSIVDKLYSVSPNLKSLCSYLFKCSIKALRQYSYSKKLNL